MNAQSIILLIEQLQSLNLSAIIDFDKNNGYAITHHSTTIEGSTLTETETGLLLDEGITPAGKPLLHSLMVQDHFNAFQLIIKKAKENVAITPDFIQAINAAAMKQTGSIYQIVVGEFDGSKGVFRKGNVSAGNTYFVSYQKVEELVQKLCDGIRQKIFTSTTIPERLTICFNAHFDLVSIHPFYDGNGKTCRLLMNYLQAIIIFPSASFLKKTRPPILSRFNKPGKKRTSTSSGNLCWDNIQNIYNWKLKNFNYWISPRPKERAILLYFSKPYPFFLSTTGSFKNSNIF